LSVAFLRTIIIYVIVVCALRIMGKRQLGELQPSELVVTILVSNLATMSIEDSSIPLLGTVMPIFTLVSCEVLVSLLAMKSSTAQRIISGNPRIIIRDGTPDQKEMKNLRWTIEDLQEQLRISGIFDISEVACAVVETSGTLSVYQKYRYRPLSLDAWEKLEGEDSPPMLIISDGKIVEDALNYCGVTQQWLEETLSRKHVTAEEVFLMTCDKCRNYHIVRKEDNK
jgi:uncharacterized membrane protein YcaP (DUF421 family)